MAGLGQSYNWRTPATFASIAVVICVGELARGRVNGWLPALVLVIVLWALVVSIIYLRTRAYLMVDGSRLTVRRFWKLTTIEAADLVAVKEFLTRNGPSYRLSVRGPDGHTRALLPTQAPQADLDKGSQKTVALPKTRGLLR